MQSYIVFGLALVAAAVMAGGCDAQATAMSSSDPERALLAVDSVEDQVALKEITLHSQWPRARKKACQKITDQEILKEIAMGDIGDKPDDDNAFGLDAAEKISSQDMLEQLARFAPNSNIRSVAVKRIDDGPLLEKIAVDDKDDSVRREALKKVNNQAVLEKAVYNETGATGIIVIERLNNQEILTEIALSDEDYSVPARSRAIAGITDLSALETIVQKYQKAEYSWSSDKSCYDVLVSSLARLVAQEGTRVGREKRIDSYFGQRHLYIDNYRQRIGPLADIIYMFEDPQLAEDWGSPRITMFTHWESKGYGVPPFGTMLYIETIYISVKLDKKPSFSVWIDGESGKPAESFLRTGTGYWPKHNYATLTWPAFIAKLKTKENELFSELQATKRYQELLRANPVENDS